MPTEISKNLIGREAIIVIQKANIVMSDNLDKDDMFFYATTKTGPIQINKNNITSIQYDDQVNKHKIVYTTSGVVRGKVKQILGKFLEIQIHNIRTDTYYDYVIPLRSIIGFKILQTYTSDDDEY